MLKAFAWLRIRWTIKRRIAIAFLAMSSVCVALGVLTTIGTGRSARLVRLTYDDILLSNNFARAAAGDFANLKASFALAQIAKSHRPDTPDPAPAYHDSFQSDLAAAIERAGSVDISTVAEELRDAELDWLAASRKIGPNATAADWAALERRAAAVESRIETMVDRVSEQGYAYRMQAQSRVDRDTLLVQGGVVGAVLLACLVAVMLSWRISAPIEAASRFAREIAGGTLDGTPPSYRSDEIGDLIRIMVAMRGDIAATMGEQVILRERWQARIAEALEGTREGVVIVDSDSVIRIANTQALSCLGVAGNQILAGMTVTALLASLGQLGAARSGMLRMQGTSSESEETLLPDGRWIRNSRHLTTDGSLVALYADITPLKDQQDRLADANRTLDAALGNMSQGLCLFDADDRLKLINARCRELFGLAPEESAIGTPYGELVARMLAAAGEPAESFERVMRYERAVIRRRRSVNRSIVLGARAIAVAHRPLEEGGWIATYEDVTERKRADERIAFLANHDALTHLPNRTMFERRVEEAIGRARRGMSFAIHCLDLDHFKQVNDTLGHAIGDQLLRAVTDRLLGCVRETDTVARLGGDEFALLQGDVTGTDAAAGLAARVVESLAAPYVIEGHDILIGASVGIAAAPRDGMSHGLLLKSADAALYKAKDDGRGTWRFFEPAMDETLQARRALEADLRRAIANEEFEVYYQPLLDVRSGKIDGFEALVRWRHPTRGMVTPDQFIPVAEETGAIKDIGRWVLAAACRQAMRWPSHLKVAVNVSTVQLRDADFVGVVTEVLAATRLPPHRLEIEITETVFMAHTTRILPLLSTLRGMGVGFAMDDFGTGYSSLGILRAFPFDKIKIDRSFIRDLASAEAAGQIITIILALGRSLGMRVTAEGVETREQLEFLKQEGCDVIQGYLVGRPMPAHEVIERLARDTDLGWVELAA